MLGTSLVACVLLSLCACDARRELAAGLARDGGFAPRRFDTAAFVLQGWLRPAADPRVRVLCVYVEGDGWAYLRPYRPSGDPTPSDPVGLRLALADPWPGPVLYLARPCQYVQDEDARGCRMPVWTTARFSPQALAALDAAVDRAKAESGARAVALHGYSGGGAMAALLAERRGDVVFLATVAGNLDTGLWTSLHHDAPLTGSLNPVDAAQVTNNLPQLHVQGGNDRVIQPSLLESWLGRLPGARIERVVLLGVGHEGPWEQAWPEILRHHRRLDAATPDSPAQTPK